jgi:hypothetical protein
MLKLNIDNIGDRDTRTVVLELSEVHALEGAV